MKTVKEYMEWTIAWREGPGQLIWKVHRIANEHVYHNIVEIYATQKGITVLLNIGILSPW